MKWLVLDCHWLAWRAFHTMGELTHEDIKTGVVYGFLKDIVRLKDDFGCNHVVFCFDHYESKRKEMFPAYKQRRHTKELTEEEEMARAELRRQIKHLRERMLPAIGFRNVLQQEGYESDDIIASIARHLPMEDDAVIISADKDLLQVLRPNVILHNPDKVKTTTLQSFKRDYGLLPEQWAQVLALAGCKTDEVPGVPGVGTITATKYIQGTLPPSSAKYRAIKLNFPTVVKRNYKLVRLPFNGTGIFTLQADQVTDQGWDAATAKLGMRSLRGRAPNKPQISHGFGLKG